ncbi:hypothetical protein BIW11_06590 [Tropilaelaps mercedesae]|uniref:Uncharacterized protein n=1 Tax=Tropilaelaps mercedesae TaxID=418985 RepID=A0A1V9XXL7_9ACAR|nr:hypothetical protein BIW11_06590 [Tropilaelaps mercedesae]
MFQAQVKEESKSSPPGSQLEAPQPPPPSTSPQTSIPQTETPSSGNVSDAEEPHHREAADGEFDRLSPERCNVVRELRLVFRNARQLIQLMLQDLLYGVPKEVWSELRIVLVILTVMLLGLYIRGMVRFNGTSFSDLLRAVFRGLRVLLGMVLHGGMTLYDTMDAMLSDASTNLVADTLREI